MHIGKTTQGEESTAGRNLSYNKNHKTIGTYFDMN
jgi:hypothetical protein